MLNYSCKDLVFHFNKKHLEDPSVPMWVVKSHGVTFYVNHVTSEMPWSTKETPDNSSTKGSIKFKKCKLTIDDDNNAIISKLGFLDGKLPHPKVVHARIIASNGGEFHQALKQDRFQHSMIKYISGGCGTAFIVCDLIDAVEVTMAALMYTNKFRILAPNEKYYQDYEGEGLYITEIEYDDDIDD